MARRRGEVFLSDSNKDRSFVLRLARVLRQHGIPYRYSAVQISGAKQWHDEIGRALGRCTWFLVALTPDSVRSRWVKRELLFGLNEDRYNEKIIPVLRKPCEHARLSWTLTEFQFVDFTEGFNDACRDLLRLWRIRYKPTAERGRRRTKRPA